MSFMDSTMWETLVEHWSSLRREQKISICLLGVCGGLALSLSLYRVRFNVLAPFLVDKNEILASKQIIGTTPDDETAKQKRTDTDGDSLSDWDEAHTYNTNPNLRDSCGDGQPDNIRVLTGKNMNCAQVNGNKYVVNPDASTTGTVIGDRAMQGLYPQAGISNFSLNATGTNFDLQAASANGTPEQPLPRDPALIRQALEGKVDAAKLHTISDEELLKLYDDAIAIQQGQKQETSDTP